MPYNCAPLFGELLRDWRQRRRLSQLELALSAEVSQRHISFVESGRAQPSRDMVVRLAEHLGVPTRERNALLVAAGHAPLHRERPLSDPAMTAARETVAMVLAAYEPFPALAVDRHWAIVSANSAVARLIRGVKAFSSEVETGSREENASKQEDRAPVLIPSEPERL